MPPRLNAFRACSSLLSSKSSSASVLAPFLRQPPQQQPHRAASILASLSDNPSSYNKRIRRGRGPASGKGKTSGRGHKGQKQHGKVPVGFQGGQTPMSVTHPTKGAINHFSVDMTPINLNRIQEWIDQGRLDPTKPITMKELNKSNCLHGVKDGVKLLARGGEELRTPINIVVSRASASAIRYVEAAGGSVLTRYYSPLAVRRVLRGVMDPANSLLTQKPVPVKRPGNPFRWQYHLPDPASRKDIEYYRDPAHRGYLSYQLGEGEGPSLFFKSPSAAQSKAMKKRKAQASANKLW
ncbi:ribosomal protein L15 [Saccharata proteae CBS 121410]|uniref:Ribosomal protein L15 n=1 Tax=Saccharata proteae CBS 121410 TaxID=1314787 RepID=A0A9P4LWU3_9PEZI|nr:ribosomal protein L15 [Saccharata proteae CBS 121410]